MHCTVVRGDAWPLLLSPCNTGQLMQIQPAKYAHTIISMAILRPHSTVCRLRSGGPDFLRMGRPFDLVPDGVWARLRRRWLPRALWHFNFERVTTHRCVAQHRQVFRGNQCPQLRAHNAGRVRSDDVAMWQS